LKQQEENTGLLLQSEEATATRTKGTLEDTGKKSGRPKGGFSRSEKY